MVFLTLVLSVIALIIAILAYQKAGGISDLKRQIEHIASSGDLKRSIDSLASATDSFKEKTAETIGRLEAAFRKDKKEEDKPPEKAAPRRRTTRKQPAGRKRAASSPKKREETTPEST